MISFRSAGHSEIRGHRNVGWIHHLQPVQITGSVTSNAHDQPYMEDIVMKSRAYAVSKKRAGVGTMEGVRSLPLAGVAKPSGVEGV